jgi:hypothetical protein
MTWGPKSTSHTVCVPDFECEKSESPHAPVVLLLGAVTEDRR